MSYRNIWTDEEKLPYKTGKTNTERQQPDSNTSHTIATKCGGSKLPKNHFARGLGAIKEKSCINVPHTRRAGGSVNLDKAMEKDFPEDNRWDYALEYDGYTFFLEVHPASTSEIKCMIKK